MLAQLTLPRQLQLTFPPQSPSSVSITHSHRHVLRQSSSFHLARIHISSAYPSQRSKLKPIVLFSSSFQAARTLARSALGRAQFPARTWCVSRSKVDSSTYTVLYLGLANPVPCLLLTASDPSRGRLRSRPLPRLTASLTRSPSSASSRLLSSSLPSR